MDEPTVHISDWVSDLLRDIDPMLTPTSDGYSEAAILAASYIAGADEALIASSLGYDREFVDIVGNRLRTAKIWQAGTLDERAKARWNDENGGVAMICDINVAKGSFLVAGYEDGEPQYSLTPNGKRHVEHIFKRD